MDIKSKIKDLSEIYFNEIVAARRHLHRHPELSFQEFETSQFVQNKLTDFGIKFTPGFVKTGIVGIIRGKNPEKRVVALRADMDALPIQEQNEIEYKSENAGKMHACGHDVHTSTLLGAAKILNEIKNEFEGSVLLLFQPGEEKLPGGAKLMIEEGALNNPKPDLIIGQHVLPLLEAGKVGFRSGLYMASTDEIYITVKGKGGHAALPHDLTDPVLIAAHMITALQQVVSRKSNAFIPTVLSFGRVMAEGTTNVIPDEVKLEGTFRTFDEEWRITAHEQIKKIAGQLAESMGGSCDVEIRIGYPSVLNDEKITKQATQFSKELLGEHQVVELDMRMTAEDFAYYSRKFPATFYRLGVMDKARKITSPLHSPTFNVDENAIKTGMAALSWLAVSFLNS
ncbi:MAG: amidohydrolase [Bacteroidales bacterium]|nr:amidohydrolase [Bacteroidales bacterium]